MTTPKRAQMVDLQAPPTGSQGPQGIPGATGAQGPQGAVGQSGLTGPQGVPGPAGVSWRGTWDASIAYAQGDGVTFSGSGFVALSASTNRQPDINASFWEEFASAGLQGAQGSQGSQGRQGTTGSGGATGSQGPQGSQGITGAGVQGVQGAQGATGTQGFQGTIGTQGASGAQGTQGNQGFQGAPGSSQAHILVAASNSAAIAKATATYLCDGIADQVEINAALAALPGGTSNGVKGSVTLAAGTYNTSAPIVNDADDVVLQGETFGFGTQIRYTAGSPSQYASIIWGQTRNPAYADLRNLTISNGDGSNNPLAGSGCGVIFRATVSRMENVLVQDSELDAYNIQSLRTAGAATTLSAAIVTTPARSAGETWAVTNAAGLPVVFPYYAAVATADPNDPRAEIVKVTAASGNNLTVIRGSYMSDIKTHLNGDAFTTFTDSVNFENMFYDLKTIFPGRHGIVLGPQVNNCEFLRLTVHGGKNLATPITTFGIFSSGGDAKWLICHVYFCQSHGFFAYDGASGAGRYQQILGGEFETNAGNGVAVTGLGSFVIRDFHCYAQTLNDILLTNVTETIVQGTMLTSQQRHIFLSGCKDLVITGNQLRQSTAGSNDIDIATTTNCQISNNITTVSSSTGRSLNVQTGCTGLDVHDNRFDRPIVEAGSADSNFYHDNEFDNTNNAGASITLVGAASRAWDNRALNDAKSYLRPVVATVGTTAASSGDLILGNAAGGAVTVTLPGAPLIRGARFRVKKTDSSGNTLTVSGTIDGAANYVISTQNTTAEFIYDGTNWWRSSGA